MIWEQISIMKIDTFTRIPATSCGMDH